MPNMTIREIQAHVEKMYSHRDRIRGSAKTFIWFVEEVGELARAIARNETENKAGEFADVFIWLCTLANVEGIDLTDAVKSKFLSNGCPRCNQNICVCKTKELP